MRAIYRLSIAAISAAILHFVTGPADAADARLSAWATGHKSQARLIAIDGVDAKTVAVSKARVYPVDDPVTVSHVALAAVEIELAHGYKTYWRHPGSDGGMPPEFDWSASDNVAAVRIGYPAPVLFKGEMGMSIGYKDGVILPLVVVPLDASRPGVLRLSMFYGVCKDICIPAEAQLEIPVAAADGGPQRNGFGLPTGTSASRSSSGPEAIAAIRLIETIHSLPQPNSELGAGDRPRLVAAKVVTQTEEGKTKGTKSLILDVAVPEGESPVVVVERGSRLAPATSSGSGSGSGPDRKYNIAISGMDDDVSQAAVTILSPSRSVVASVPIR